MVRGTHITALAINDTHFIYSQSTGEDIEESERGLTAFETAWNYDDIAFETKVE